MNQLLESGIIFLIAALILLQVSYKKDAGQHKRYKFFHAVFVVSLVVIHSYVFRLLGWVVSHPNEILETFYIEKGILSPATSLAIWILYTCISVVAVSLGFALAKRKESSLRKVFQLIPLIAVANWLEGFAGGMVTTSLSTKGYIVVGTILTLLVVIPYGLMLFFYSRPSVQLSIFGVKKENVSNHS